MHIAVHAIVAFGVCLLAVDPAVGQGGGTTAPRPDTIVPATRPEVVVPTPRPDSIARAVVAPAPQVAPPRPRSERADRWKFGAEFSFTDQSGNKALRVLTTGLKFSHREKQSFELDGILQSRYGKSDGEVVARHYFASTNFSPRPTAIWAPSLSIKAERDPFKRLDLRFSAGAGAKFTPFQAEKGNDELSVSWRLSYEFTNLRPREDAVEREMQHRPRWTMEVRGTRQLSPGITAQHQSSFEPSWGELANYLLRSQTGLKILLTKRLALSVDYQLNRTNHPPVGVEPDDRLFRTGIIIDF